MDHLSIKLTINQRMKLQSSRQIKTSFHSTTTPLYYESNKYLGTICLVENKELYELLVKYKEGDKTAFSLFYEELKKPVFYNILSYVKDYNLSEDLLQETFVRLLSNLHKLKKDKSIIGYMMILSKNICLDYLKKHKSIELEESDLEKENNNLGNFDMEDINQSDIVSYLKKILTDEEFKVLIFHLVEEQTFKEISIAMKIPLGTVQWIYTNAINKTTKERGNLK